MINFSFCSSVVFDCLKSNSNKESDKIRMEKPNGLHHLLLAPYTSISSIPDSLLTVHRLCKSDTDVNTKTTTQSARMYFNAMPILLADRIVN